jgi:hypothetical protein
MSDYFPSLTSNSSGLGGGGFFSPAGFSSSSTGFLCLTSFCSVGEVALASCCWGLRLRGSSRALLRLGCSVEADASSLLGERRRDSDVRVAAGATRLYSVVLVAATAGRLELVRVSVIVVADTR